MSFVLFKSSLKYFSKDWAIVSWPNEYADPWVIESPMNNHVNESSLSILFFNCSCNESNDCVFTLAFWPSPTTPLIVLICTFPSFDWILMLYFDPFSNGEITNSFPTISVIVLSFNVKVYTHSWISLYSGISTSKELSVLWILGTMSWAYVSTVFIFLRLKSIPFVQG